MNAVAVTTTSTLIRRSAPAARAAAPGSRRRCARATLTLGTSGCSASARTASSAEPVSAASIVVRSTSLMVETSACACGGVGPIATGTGPAAADDRGHLDDGVLVEERQRGAVGGVEDHDRAGVVGDRLDERQRLALVAAGLAAVVVLVRDAGGAARLGHVGAVALVAGGAPGAERRGRVLAVLGVEGGLRLEQVRAARLVLLPDRRHRVRTEVEVVQVLVRDHPERAQPVAAEQAPLLEAGERRVVGEQLRQPVAVGVRGRLQPAEVVEAEVVEPHLVGRRGRARGRRAGTGRAACRRCRSRGRRAPGGRPP